MVMVVAADAHADGDVAADDAHDDGDDGHRLYCRLGSWSSATGAPSFKKSRERGRHLASTTLSFSRVSNSLCRGNGTSQTADRGAKTLDRKLKATEVSKTFWCLDA